MKKNLPTFLILIAVIFTGCYLIPWENINWGKIEMTPTSTITVTGEAKTQTTNQIAEFSAGVNETYDDKQQAVSEVNQKIENIIAAVKQFGIKDADIKTQNLSIYQRDESYWEGDRQKTRKGQWNVSNTIKIKLRNVDRAADFATLLSDSGATNVYGPNFSLEDTDETGNSILAEAINNAKEKAQIMAAADNREVGKIISVSEGSSAAPYYPVAYARAEAGGGGGVAVEPGASTVYKNVTVVFELK